jgi:hypothetical protein
MRKTMILQPGIHVETNLDSLAQALQKGKQSGFRVFDVDLTPGTGSKQALFDRLRIGLLLPEYFGANWDALEESLRDFEIGQNTGFLLVFRSADALLKLPAADRRTLVSILDETVRFWQSEGRPFSSVFVGSGALAEAITSANERNVRS